MSKENDKDVFKVIENLEKEVDFLLDKLHKYEIENKKMKSIIDYLHNKNSILHENKRYSVKSLKELLKKFDEFEKNLKH